MQLVFPSTVTGRNPIIVIQISQRNNKSQLPSFV